MFYAFGETRTPTPLLATASKAVVSTNSTTKACSADGETRTPTVLRPTDFESVVSTNSTTSAYVIYLRRMRDLNPQIAINDPLISSQLGVPMPNSPKKIPEVGLEPTRPCDQGILSPQCLPIPPLWLNIHNIEYLILRVNDFYFILEEVVGFEPTSPFGRLFSR